MNNHPTTIIYEAPESQERIITLEQSVKRHKMRRRHVAKRMWKRAPMFAVEFMQDEFPGYTYEDLEAELTRKMRKSKSKRKKKSPMTIQGRYIPMRQALADYERTGDLGKLRQAQKLRDRLFQPFVIEYRIGKKMKWYSFPSTSSYGVIVELAQLKVDTFDELDEIIKDKTRYGLIG